MTQDGRVIGYTFNDHAGVPVNTEFSVYIGKGFRISAKLDGLCAFRPVKFPGIPEMEPVIGILDLGTILNTLFKHTVFIAESITDSGYLQGGQRIEITGRKSSQPPVAEAGFYFQVDQLVNIQAQFLHGLPCLFKHT